MAIADPFWSDRLFPTTDSGELLIRKPVTFYPTPQGPSGLQYRVSKYGDISRWVEPSTNNIIEYFKQEDLGYKPVTSLKIAFEDPYPNFNSVTQIDPLNSAYKLNTTDRPKGLFKLNFDYNQIMPLIWNMKEWNVTFSASTTMRVNNTLPPYNQDWSSWIISNGSVSGKFHYADVRNTVISVFEGSWELFLQDYGLDPATPFLGDDGTYHFDYSYLSLTTKRQQPKERTNGSIFYPPNNNNIIYPNYAEGDLLPNPSIYFGYEKPDFGDAANINYGGPFTLSFSDSNSILNGSASTNVSGSISAIENYGPEGYATSNFQFKADSIYIRNDGTVDLYFYLGGGYLDSPQFSGDMGGSAAEFILEPFPYISGDFTTDGIVGVFYSEWGCAGSTTVNILGKPLTVYRNYRYEQDWGWFISDFFPSSIEFDISLSYDIDVSEFWEYE